MDLAIQERHTSISCLQALVTALVGVMDEVNGLKQTMQFEAIASSITIGEERLDPIAVLTFVPSRDQLPAGLR